MKNYVILLCSLLYCLSAVAQNPPQKVNANYQFQAVGADSATRISKHRATNPNFLDSGALQYNLADSNLYVWTGHQWLCKSCGGSSGGTAVSFSPLDSLAGVASGAQANNNRISMQSVAQTGTPGLLKTADYNHFVTTYKYFQNTHATNLIGYPDTSVHSVSGTNNVLLGSGSGIVLGSGSNNVGIGSFSLNASTTGGSNVAVGFVALETNSTGIQNTAVGSGSLSNDPSSSGNTAVGALSLFACHGCSSNTAVGLQANTNCTSCASNTIVGSGAAQNGTTGSFNTVVGNLALNRLTTGNSNTAVGYGAVSGNTTGVDNTGVGAGAMDFMTIGRFNTAVGSAAMGQDSIGLENVAIGDHALTGFGDTNCIAIGEKALFGDYPNGGSGSRGSNRSIAIGDSIGFFLSGGGTRFSSCILIGNNINQALPLDTIRKNITVVGNDIVPDTDNIVIIGIANQHIRLGNGGGNTALENSSAPDKASDVYYNKDSASYIMFDGTARYKWRKQIQGSFSGTGTATTTFSVSFTSIGTSNYVVMIEPTNTLSAVPTFVTNKTSTGFVVNYVTGLTGTVTFDYILSQ